MLTAGYTHINAGANVQILDIVQMQIEESPCMQNVQTKTTVGRRFPIAVIRPSISICHESSSIHHAVPFELSSSTTIKVVLIVEIDIKTVEEVIKAPRATAMARKSTPFALLTTRSGTHTPRRGATYTTARKFTLPERLSPAPERREDS